MLDTKTMKSEIKKVENRIADLETKRDYSIADLEKKREEAIDKLNQQITDVKADYKERISITSKDFKAKIAEANGELKTRLAMLDDLIEFEKRFNAVGKGEIVKPTKRKKKVGESDDEEKLQEELEEITFEVDSGKVSEETIEPQENAFFGGY